MATYFFACTSDATAQLYCTVNEATGVTIEAIGAEFDPHFFSANVARNEGVTADDWNVVVRRIDALGLTKLRIMVLPHWYEPQNDDDDPFTCNQKAFTFDSPEMKSLYAVLDVAQSRGISVTIVLWGCPAGGFLAGENSGNWVVAPSSVEEWCESFAVLINHLISVRKYTCIKEITPVNEPDWSYIISGKPAPVAKYAEMCRKLHERFKRDNIRDKVSFNLSDNTDGAVAYLQDCADMLGEVADKFNSHTYAFGYTTPDSAIYKWERHNVMISQQTGRHHFVGEFGSNLTVGSTKQRDIDSYERGVLMSRIVLNSLNAGACGVSYWSLIDQYYGRYASYDEMQQLGLWRHLKKTYDGDSMYSGIHIYGDYSIRPQFYAYGLLCNFIRPGAETFPLKTANEYVTASAFLHPQTGWTYIAANATDTIQAISITNSRKGAKRMLKTYEYTRKSVASANSDNITKQNGGLKPINENIDIFTKSVRTIKPHKNTITLVLPPQSVVVCTRQNAISRTSGI